MPFHERTDGRALRNAAGPNLIDLLAADHVKHRRKRLDPDLERLEGRLLIHGVTVVDRKRWALGLYDDPSEVRHRMAHPVERRTRLIGNEISRIAVDRAFLHPVQADRGVGLIDE